MSVPRQPHRRGFSLAAYPDLPENGIGWREALSFLHPRERVRLGSVSGPSVVAVHLCPLAFARCYFISGGALPPYETYILDEVISRLGGALMAMTYKGRCKLTHVKCKINPNQLSALN